MKTSPRRLLFVCTGNICRSLMAERLAVKLAAARGIALEARSCGVAAESYYTPPQEVNAALAPVGLNANGHKAQLISRDLLRWCDEALTMTRGHRAAILDAYPEFTSKVFVLRPRAGVDDADVADPYGRPQHAFDFCRDRLIETLEALFAKADASEPR